jgi:hypothetical protein
VIGSVITNPMMMDECVDLLMFFDLCLGGDVRRRCVRTLCTCVPHSTQVEVITGTHKPAHSPIRKTYVKYNTDDVQNELTKNY